MLSRSGETWRPSTSTSSPTLPITVTDDGSTTSARPRRKRAPPTPPESTATLGIVGDTTEAVNPEHTPPETLRAEWRRPHRLPGGRRRASRSRRHPGRFASRRARLGEPAAGTLLQPARFDLTTDPLRQARNRDVRPRVRCADAGGSNGRHPCRDGRSRLRRAVLWGPGDAGPLCMLFAATYPERTLGLILFNSMPRMTRAPDMPWLARVPLQSNESRRSPALG